METPTPPPPPLGPDEDTEPRARHCGLLKCEKCRKPHVWWDGDKALWCANKDCPEFEKVYWNGDVRELLL